MRIRDRIKELRRVPASQLRPNPKNWRVHPQGQQDALRGVLAEIGYADALVARELPDGSLELIDGHLRAEITPDQEVPVLVLDVDEREAAKLLAVLDPLAGLAETNQDVLAELLAEVETENDALQAVLDDLAARDAAALDEKTQEPPPEIDVPEAFQVVVECRDEADQKAVFEQLTAEGRKCRLLTL
jgi:ParB-like chromosome segregation protein Spo0J